MAIPAQPKELITMRLPQSMAAEIRRLAALEGEGQSVILRKLIKLGLGLSDTERRIVSEAQS